MQSRIGLIPRGATGELGCGPSVNPEFNTGRGSSEHGDINVSISATGNPNAAVTVQVGSQVPGTIPASCADFNTKVTNGQLTAHIDPAAFQAKVDQERANLDASRAGVANAEARVRKVRAGIQAANASFAAAVANVVKAKVAARPPRSRKKAFSPRKMWHVAPPRRPTIAPPPMRTRHRRTAASRRG